MNTKIYLTIALIAVLLTACQGVNEPIGLPTWPAEPTAAPTQRPLPTATPVPTVMPQPAECPPAEQLGPWAPTNGRGEDFEVTAHAGPLVLSLYWPQGKLPNGQPIDWGIDEVVVLLQQGTSIQVWNGAGTGFQYAASCPQAEVQRQLNGYLTDRPRYTAHWHGLVTLDELLRLGLVTNRLPLPTP